MVGTAVFKFRFENSSDLIEVDLIGVTKIIQKAVTLSNNPDVLNLAGDDALLSDKYKKDISDKDSKLAMESVLQYKKHHSLFYLFITSNDITIRIQ